MISQTEDEDIDEAKKLIKKLDDKLKKYRNSDIMEIEEKSEVLPSIKTMGRVMKTARRAFGNPFGGQFNLYNQHK